MLVTTTRNEDGEYAYRYRNFKIVKKYSNSR